MKTKHILETPEELLHAFFEYRSQDDEFPRATGEIVLDTADGYLRAMLHDPVLDWEGDTEELLAACLKRLGIKVSVVKS